LFAKTKGLTGFGGGGSPCGRGGRDRGGGRPRFTGRIRKGGANPDARLAGFGNGMAGAWGGK